MSDPPGKRLWLEEVPTGGSKMGSGVKRGRGRAKKKNESPLATTTSRKRERQPFPRDKFVHHARSPDGTSAVATEDDDNNEEEKVEEEAEIDRSNVQNSPEDGGPVSEPESEEDQPDVQSPLVETRLVTEDSMVVLAEPAGPESSQNKWINFLSTTGGRLTCLLLVSALTAIAITGIVCGSGLCSPDSSENANSSTSILLPSTTAQLQPSLPTVTPVAPPESLTMNHTEPPSTSFSPSDKPSEVPSASPTTLSPTESPTNPPLVCPQKGTLPCLSTREELLNALDQFLEEGTLFGNQPIDCWCFAPELEDFSGLFDGSEYGRRDDNKAASFDMIFQCGMCLMPRAFTASFGVRSC